MKRLTFAQAARGLRYLEAELAQHEAGTVRHTMVLRQLPLYREYVATHCRDCGKRLTDPESLLRGYGPECAKRQDPDPMSDVELQDEAADLGAVEDVA